MIIKGDSSSEQRGMNGGKVHEMMGGRRMGGAGYRVPTDGKNWEKSGIECG